MNLRLESIYFRIKKKKNPTTFWAGATSTGNIKERDRSEGTTIRKAGDKSNQTIKRWFDKL